MRKLAVLFFGCARTYFKTYTSFFEYVIDINKKDGWEIDIFIHTWDLFEKSGYAWHKNEFPTLNNKKLELKDIENIKEVYKPKKIVIDSLGDKHGAKFSKEKVVQLVADYENENRIKYDYYLSTRMDILFISPLKINTYIEPYKNGKVAGLKLPEKHTFVAFNPFVRMPVVDMRYINEGDIIYFSNFCFKEVRPECCSSNFAILINYRCYQDYFLQRENIAYGSNRTDILQKLLIQPQATKERIIEVVKEKVVVKQTPIPSIYLVAKDRIHSHLAYKLGQAMILNSKSFLGYIRMPYVLSYIQEAYNKEQKEYQAKVAKNPKLKLPPLESYADYKEALKEKQCFTYKLGEALITANSVRGGGEYLLTLPFSKKCVG